MPLSRPFCRQAGLQQMRVPYTAVTIALRPIAYGWEMLAMRPICAQTAIEPILILSHFFAGWFSRTMRACSSDTKHAGPLTRFRTFSVLKSDGFVLVSENCLPATNSTWSKIAYNTDEASSTAIPSATARSLDSPPAKTLRRRWHPKYLSTWIVIFLAASVALVTEMRRRDTIGSRLAAGVSAARLCERSQF